MGSLEENFLSPFFGEVRGYVTGDQHRLEREFGMTVLLRKWRQVDCRGREHVSMTFKGNKLNSHA